MISVKRRGSRVLLNGFNRRRVKTRKLSLQRRAVSCLPTPPLHEHRGSCEVMMQTVPCNLCRATVSLRRPHLSLSLSLSLSFLRRNTAFPTYAQPPIFPQTTPPTSTPPFVPPCSDLTLSRQSDEQAWGGKGQQRDGGCRGVGVQWGSETLG